MSANEPTRDAKFSELTESFWGTIPNPLLVMAALFCLVDPGTRPNAERDLLDGMQKADPHEVLLLSKLLQRMPLRLLSRLTGIIDFWPLEEPADAADDLTEDDCERIAALLHCTREKFGAVLKNIDELAESYRREEED
jgi:hypothetical protein